MAAIALPGNYRLSLINLFKHPLILAVLPALLVLALAVAAVVALAVAVEQHIVALALVVVVASSFVVVDIPNAVCCDFASHPQPFK